MNNELPSSPISLLNLMASTSVQIDVFSDAVIESVKQGEESAIKVHLQLKAMEKASERILKETKENALNEADKYPGNEFEVFGNKIQKGDVRTEYDYTVCGDTKWERLKADFDTAKRLLDERSAFLKAMKDPQPMVDELTGEVVTVCPPLKKSTPGLKFFIK